MALIYKNFAIISLGMSCQSAHQIELNKEALDDIIGETSEQRRTPLDFIVAPPIGAAALVRRSFYFPHNAYALRHVEGKRFYWKRRGVWFFHDSKAKDRMKELSQKFAYMGQNLKSIAQRPTLAIWTNTQRNLSQDIVDTPIDYMARQGELDTLLNALRKHCPNSEMLNVVRPERIDSTDPLREDEHVLYDHDDRPFDWKGNDAAWSGILSDALNSDRIQRLIAGQTQ